MALPKIDVPVYSIELPSTGEVIKYRPFLVREQKQLLIAQNAGLEQQTQAVIDLVAECTFNKLDVRKLPAYDLEFLFLRLRANSVGENIDLVLTCGECENRQDAQLDLTAVQVKKYPDHNNNVDLGGGLLVNLADPDLENLAVLRGSANPDVNQIIRLIASCIKTIWKDEDMYSALDYSPAELIEFVENLSPANFGKLEQFFLSMPKLRHEINFKCNKCGADNTAALEGLQSFFG
jgi:ribosomal protein L44E